ncbi:MAG TPA: GRP family sugar transporter [Terriglobales bacterium]|nr:GRP family sugar transporter [Terriglobales bacterium]
MYLPDSYAVALLFMIATMLCWGSWANTMKLSPGFRFQLFYWDYIIGLFVGIIALGLTIGSSGSRGAPFLQDIANAPQYSIVMALLGGAVFNVANLLLVAAIEIAGLAVAFPVGIGVALIVGALSNYIIAPKGNPLLLFGGIALVMVAIICDALAYKSREGRRKSSNARGIVISLVCGILMGSFYPLVSKSMAAPNAPGPYATAFFFVIGTALCSIPVNYFFMRRPIDGSAPVCISDYFSASKRWHVAGVLGGVIWVIGTTLNFVASQVNFVGPAISYSIGQGATMVSALWGVFIWREFASPSVRVRNLLIAMFACFVAGLGAIAMAPLY